MNILIMGAPGAGKGTMSTKIVEEFNVNHISTGNIFRSEVGNQTELGLEAKKYMDQGLLVPDEVTNPMVKSFLSKLENNNGFLLDGYPRTIEQAKVFDELTKGTNLEIEKVITLDMPLEELSMRITGRRLCKNCEEIFHTITKPSKVEGVCDKCGSELYQRKDDTEESLKVRLDEYNNSTEPVLSFYEEKGMLVRVNANQPIDEVWKETLSALVAK